MAKPKTNKQLPGQMSIFDGQRMQELYNKARELGKELAGELSALQELLEKMSLEEWNADENALRRDLKECLVITGIHMTDVISQMSKASAIEFQMKISNSLQG